MPALDEIDEARARECELIGALLWRAPTAATLAALRDLQGDASPLGMAHLALAEAADEATPESLRDEFFELFIGVGRGELLPYASYYLTGFLHERPLALVREDMGALGLARDERAGEPEDHIAVLLDIMAKLIRGEVSAESVDADRFFCPACRDLGRALLRRSRNREGGEILQGCRPARQPVPLDRDAGGEAAGMTTTAMHDAWETTMSHKPKEPKGSADERPGRRSP